MRALLLALLFLATQALGQVSSSPPLVGQKWTTAPAACSVGQLGFDTDATAGSNLFGCTSANTWTLLGSSGLTIGTTAITSGTDTRVLFNDAGVVGEDAGMVFNKTTNALTITGAFASSKLTESATAGGGLTIAAGTATTDVAALSVTRTNNNAAVATGVKFTFTDTTSAAGFLPFQILCGAAGTTNCLSLSKSGDLALLGSTITGGNATNGIGLQASSTYGVRVWQDTPRARFENTTAEQDFYISTKAGHASSDAAQPGNLVIIPGTVGASTTTDIVGRDVSIFGGIASSGAAGAANGGNVFLEGGQAFGTGVTGNVIVGATRGNLALGSSAKVVMATTAPTIASGGCTSPTVTNTNGTAYFTIDVGTSCSGNQAVVFTLPAATTGWHCYARNVTNGASSAPAQTGAISTTSVTITNFVRTTGVEGAWTDGDDVTVSCLGG